MRYIGAKSSSVSEIFNIVNSTNCEGTFCDPFGGTSTVGAFFKEKGFKVYTGDLLLFAHYFQISLLHFNQPPAFKKLVQFLKLENSNNLSDYLNNLPQINDGWLAKNYAIERFFFTLTNARRIEACWIKIISFFKQELISYEEMAFLLASLINSMDKVANTAGTYYAYLKKFTPKSLNVFQFKLLIPAQGNVLGESFLLDAHDLITKRPYDVIYLDPPYNDRRYHGYYHLPETIARCEESKISGKSGVSKFNLEIKSNFYNTSEALTALCRILEQAQFKTLVFHYRNDGLIKPHRLIPLFEKYGTLSIHEVTGLAYTTGNNKRSTPTQLYKIQNA